MKIQFDWDFDQEMKTSTVSNQDRAKRRGPRRVRGYSAEDYRPFEERAAASKAVFGTVLTRNQRHMHAAVAKVRPWLCPQGQPEPFVRSHGSRKSFLRNRLAGFCSRLRGHPDQIVLTRSQRRLHATLARTRPWICPHGRPE